MFVAVFIGAMCFAISFLALTWLDDPVGDFKNWFGAVLVGGTGLGAVALVLMVVMDGIGLVVKRSRALHGTDLVTSSAPGPEGRQGPQAG